MKSALMIAAVLALGIPGAVLPAPDAPRVAQAAAAHQAEGTVHKVDPAAGTFNMSHGPVPSLNWPAMTMDFQVKDKAILRDIKPGQKVEISIIQEGPTKFFVTRIQPLK
jgi:Cu/Ag efflux protein CusF